MPRRQSSAVIVLGGEPAISNEWVDRVVRTMGHRVARRANIDDLQAKRGRDELWLILGSTPQHGVEIETTLSACPDDVAASVLLVLWPSAMRRMSDDTMRRCGDFMCMPGHADELSMRLRRLRERGRQAEGDGASFRSDLPAADPLTRTLGGSVRLSDLEYRIYLALATRHGEVLTRDDLLRMIWGEERAADPRSNIVDVYVSYLRAKLSKAHPSIAIRTVRGVGYALERSDDA